MSRLSAASYARNRELQHLRNKRNNPRRTKEQFSAARIHALESRPFIGWDGEGYDAYSVDSFGTAEIQHRYMLFGCSTGQYVSSINLHTQECLDLILFVKQENSDAVFVGFAFEYDVNMILRDLESRYVAMLSMTGKIKWRGYTIEHVPDKQFIVRKGGISATIYDVFGFFHTAYIKALGKFAIGSAQTIARITAGKNRRGSFTYADLAFVVAYWMDEISLLPPLMDEIRKTCYDAGFYITKWHGPGALAAYVLQKSGAHSWHGKNVPKRIQIARRFAYAGGRFQDWKAGDYNGDVYTADINSAYAYAISKLPRMDTGHWRKIDPGSIHKPSDIPEFALCYIRYDAREMATKARVQGIPFPLFHRDSRGYLTWPPAVENWYWTPEARTVAGSRYAEFIEVWEFVSDGSYPFRDMVYGAYARRVQLQHTHNYAEQAYKWFLASIYGQFAQRVGWDTDKRTAPRSHCLEWAGYITSFCRAWVYMASVDIAKRGGLISIDTDGVTSSVPFNHARLPTGIGENLGQWKLEHFSGILHWQNGIYWHRTMDGQWTEPKTRGIPRGRLSYDTAKSSLQNHRVGFAGIDSRCAIGISRTRFIGYRQSVAGQWKNWRAWKKESVDVTFGGGGKGRHIPKMCDKCRGVSPAYKHAQMHTITHLWPDTMLSSPHDLPWLRMADAEEKNITTEYIVEDDLW